MDGAIVHRIICCTSIGTTDRAAVPMGNDQPEDANKQTRVKQPRKNVQKTRMF